MNDNCALYLLGADVFAIPAFAWRVCESLELDSASPERPKTICYCKCQWRHLAADCHDFICRILGENEFLSAYWSLTLDRMRLMVVFASVMCNQLRWIPLAHKPHMAHNQFLLAQLNDAEEHVWCAGRRQGRWGAASMYLSSIIALKYCFCSLLTEWGEHLSGPLNWATRASMIAETGGGVVWGLGGHWVVRTQGCILLSKSSVCCTAWAQTAKKGFIDSVMTFPSTLSPQGAPP